MMDTEKIHVWTAPNGVLTWGDAQDFQAALAALAGYRPEDSAGGYPERLNALLDSHQVARRYAGEDASAAG